MWAIILHGGAKEIEPDEAEANRSGCLRALSAGRAVLEGGGSALDAVEAAIRVLEDYPAFNCGYGSVLNAAGEVEYASPNALSAFRRLGLMGDLVDDTIQVATGMLAAQLEVSVDEASARLRAWSTSPE